MAGSWPVALGNLSQSRAIHRSTTRAKPFSLLSCTSNYVSLSAKPRFPDLAFRPILTDADPNCAQPPRSRSGPNPPLPEPSPSLSLSSLPRGARVSAACHPPTRMGPDRHRRQSCVFWVLAAKNCGGGGSLEGGGIIILSGRSILGAEADGKRSISGLTTDPSCESVIILDAKLFLLALSRSIPFPNQKCTLDHNHMHPSSNLRLRSRVYADPTSAPSSYQFHCQKKKKPALMMIMICIEESVVS